MFKSALLVIALSMLISPRAAEAATRYASPADAGVAQPCTADAPCSLRTALGHAADGDRVIVAPGRYAVGAPIDVSDRRLEIVAASSADRPVLASTVGGGDATLSLGQRSLLRDIDIEQSGAGGAAVHAEGLVERVRVALRAPFARGLWLRGDVTVRDTVIFGTGHASQDGITAYAAVAGGPITARLRNVTVVADGDDGVALEARSAVDLPVDVDLRASVLRGTREDAVLYGAAGAPATMRALDANLRDRGVARGAPSVYVPVGGMTDAEPRFADRAAGDLRPAAGSPTIDAGSADQHTGSRDAMGLPRVQGSAIDVGAYERIVAPPVRVAGVDAGAPDMLTVTGEITPGPWRLTVRWRLELLDDDAIVATGPTTLALFSDRQTRTFSGLQAGHRYRARVVATGGFGESTGEVEVRTAALPEVADAGVPAGGTPPPAAGAPALAPAPAPAVPTADAPAIASPGPPAARRDRTAPRVRVAWRGRGLRITASERARVTITLRRRGGRTLRRRTLTLRRGTTTVRTPRVTRSVCSVQVTAKDTAGNRSARTFRRPARRCR